MAACLRILTVKMLTGSLIAKYLVKSYPVKLRVISTKAPVGPVILMVQTVIICILFCHGSIILMQYIVFANW